jgi:hypothetical protein
MLLLLYNEHVVTIHCQVKCTFHLRIERIPIIHEVKYQWSGICTCFDWTCNGENACKIGSDNSPYKRSAITPGRKDLNNYYFPKNFPENVAQHITMRFCSIYTSNKCFPELYAFSTAYMCLRLVFGWPNGDLTNGYFNTISQINSF